MPASDPEDVLAALSRVEDQRRALDETEHALIAAARAAGLGWAKIADALGLRSRQAAEQRFLRLGEPAQRDPGQARARRRQHFVDDPALESVRTAAVAVLRQVERDPRWDARHPRAALARASLAMAVDAPGGALFALVQNALQDLAGDGPMPGLAPARRAIERLREAWLAATP